MVSIHLYRLAVLINVILSTLAKVTEREIFANKRRKFLNTADVGVSPIGRTSYQVKLKSCDNALIVLSNIERVNNHNGRYFIILLGKHFNERSTITDSCYNCKPNVTVTKPVLVCDSYMPFWISWDNKERVTVGEGNTLGARMLMEYKTNSPFEVMYSQITTLKKSGSPPDRWKFLLYDEVNFLAPHKEGSTIVNIPETTAIGSVIYQIKVNAEVSISMVTNSTHFRLLKNAIVVKEKLDYEKQRFYMIVIKINELDINATLTILLEDVNDETPDVVLGQGVRIPEELPVGFVIGGVFTAKDGDANDTLTYTLEGADSRYFTLLGQGLLKLEHRIDRDGPKGRHQLADLTLRVEDEGHHVSSHVLAIIVDDINDNVPKCASGLFTTTIKHDATIGNSIMKIPCTDIDSGRNGQFSLRIVPNLDAHFGRRKRFWLTGSSLYADIKQLRRESSRRQSSPYILKLLAVDTPSSGQPHTGTAVVVINLEHKKHQRVNDHRPTWRQPVPDKQAYFRDQRVSEVAPPGTAVMRFHAEDEDPGTMVAYMIHSITADGDNNATGPFLIDLKSGVLKTSGPLDCDEATGGVKSYVIRIIATDGEHVINGFLRVLLDNANDNKPIFNSIVHAVSVKTIKNIAKPITEFHVADYDKGPPISLSISTKDYHYFRLVQESEKWFLKFRVGIGLDDVTIPHVVVVTANDNDNPSKSNQAVVILNDIACPGALNPNANETTGTFAAKAVRNGDRNSAKHARNTPRTGIQLGVDYTEGSQNDGGVSNVPPENECPPVKTTSADSARTGLYLKVACAVEGLIIVMALLLVLAKRCGCLKKAGQTERKEPLGCENAIRLHDNQRRQSLKKKDGKTNMKRGQSSGTPTPTSCIPVDPVGELPTTCQKKVHIEEPAAMMVEQPNIPTTSQMLTENELSLKAKSKFLGLRKNAFPADPVKLYSDPSGVNLYDTEMMAVARTRFLELIKDSNQQVSTETCEMIFVAKAKFLNFLKQKRSEAPLEMLTYLDDENTEIVALAKGKFLGLTKERCNAELDLTKDSRPLDIVSLLDGSWHDSSEDTILSVAKDKFLAMLKENNIMNKFMTNNDAILEYAAGYNPSKNTVYIAKNKFFELVKKDGTEDKTDDEVLSISKDRLLELLSSDVDPWTDNSNAVIKYICGIDPENGDMFIKKDTFMSLVKNIDKTDSDMIAVSKPKLAEMLQGNSENPKCNDTLNYYITAVSPTTGMVYMFKDKFNALVRANGSESGDLLEVDVEEMHRLASNDKDKHRVESLLKLASLGFSESKNILYVAKNKFIDLACSNENGHVSADDNEVMEIPKETIVHMIESSGGDDINPVAVNKDSVFVAKQEFLALLRHGNNDENLIEVSKDNFGSDNDSFLKKHALAFARTSGKVYIGRKTFMDFLKEKRSKTSPQDLEDEDEMVYVPQEQLPCVQKNTNGQRTKTAIQRNAEGINPITGAIFMAKKRFLNIADKETFNGNDVSEVICVAKDTLMEMIPEDERSTSDTDATLSKYAMAFSSDNATAYMAKSKFMELRNSAMAKAEHEDGSVADADDLIAISVESLSQMGEQEDCDTVDDIVKKYATAFNPKTKVAYLTKHTFMNMASRLISSNREDESCEIVAVPKEKLVELTAGEGNQTVKARIKNYAVAINDSQSTIYVAKNRFMKLMEQKAASSGKAGWKDTISISQKKLDQMLTAAGDNADHSGSSDALRKLALAVNPLTKTVYMARNTFSDLANKYVQSSGTSNRENDIVALSETQVSNMLEGSTGDTSRMLKKYALAFNKGNDNIYFVKKKFEQLASSVKQIKVATDRSEDFNTSGISRTSTGVKIPSKEEKHFGNPIEYQHSLPGQTTMGTIGKQIEDSIHPAIPTTVNEAQRVLPVLYTHKHDTLTNTDTCPSHSNVQVPSGQRDPSFLGSPPDFPNHYEQRSPVGQSMAPLLSTQTVVDNPMLPERLPLSESPPTRVSSAANDENASSSDFNHLVMHDEFSVLDVKTAVSDWEDKRAAHDSPQRGVAVVTSSEYASDGMDADSDTSGCTAIHKPGVVLTITDDFEDDEELDALANTQLTRKTSTLGRIPTSERKSKKKVKSWDPDVRTRLYASKEKHCKKSSNPKKQTRKGSKHSPEQFSSEMEAVPKQKARRQSTARRKSVQMRHRSSAVHPEMDAITSETDDCFIGMPPLLETDLNKRVKAK